MPRDRADREGSWRKKRSSNRPSVSANPADRRYYRRRGARRFRYFRAKSRLITRLIATALSTLKADREAEDDGERRKEEREREQRRFHAPTVRDGIVVTVGKRSHRERSSEEDAIKSVKLVIRRGFAHALACAGSTFVSLSHLVRTAAIVISRCKARPPRRAAPRRAEPRPILWKSEKPARVSSVSRHELDFRYRCSTMSAFFQIQRTDR